MRHDQRQVVVEPRHSRGSRTRARSIFGCNLCRWTLAIIKRYATAQGFEVLLCRWFVELTFVWLGRCRGLAKDSGATIRQRRRRVIVAYISMLALPRYKTLNMRAFPGQTLRTCALAGVLFAQGTVATGAPTAEYSNGEPRETVPAAAKDSTPAVTNESVPTAEPSVKKELMDEIIRGFYWRLNVLSYGAYQNLQNNAPLNPDNFFSIPTYQAAINPRLDLNLNVRQFELGVKPRFLYLWQRWEEGVRANQQDSRTEFYVNEWIARYRPIDELSLSYGRENLQWGPSKIVSSSNPFNQNNGQNNPWLEVPGLDYARAVWVPNSTLTASFIANTAKGRLGEPLELEFNANEPSVDFNRSYALKADWTGDSRYVSVIPSYREDTGYRIGVFGGWDVTDAILLYAEGADGNYNGLQLQAGSSYTFEGGMTVNLEYYHNGNGCASKDIDRCFRDGDANFSGPLVRGDYILLQYSDHDIWDHLSVDIRLINNLNDTSTQLTGILEYEVGAHTQLYLVSTGYMGGRDDEFGGLLEYSLFGGVAYTF